MIAIYSRQSIDKKDSISIETQIEFCRHEAKGEEYKVYSDKGYSGKNTNRPGFENMMDDIKRGLINKVVVYRLDRISRSIVDFADFIDSLEKYNTSFISATEKFDTAAPMGRAMLYIIIVFAQLERETIAERIKDNYYERIKRGGIGGGPAPYGFDISKITIDGTKMSSYTPNGNIETVKKIFDMYTSAGVSLADIQRYLKEKNIKTASGKPWDNTKLSTLIKSPSYVKADISIYNYYKQKGAVIASPLEDFNGENACLLVGKRNSNTRKYSDITDHILAVSAHKGIVDSGTFLLCQQKLSENRQIKNLHKGKYSWLTGFVKCGYCGYSFSVRKSRTSEGETAYFYDSGKYLYKTCTHNQTHRVKDVEDVVESELIRIIEKIDFKEKEDTPVNNQNINKIKEIDAKISNLILALEDCSGVSSSYINTRIAELDMEKQELLDKISSDALNRKKTALPKIEDYNNMSFEEKRLLAKMLIDKVILTDDKIEISYK